MPDLPVNVYGVGLLVRLVDENEAAIHLHCPKGGAVLYGHVVSCGDGFDPKGHVFRSIPDVDAIVAFEDDPEDPEGHSFTAAGDDYRLITVDHVLMAWPSRGWRPKTT